MLAKSEQALPLASGELEATGDGVGTGAILFLEHLGGRVGCHDAAPLVRGEQFRVLRDGDKSEIAFACPAGQVGQEASALRMLDERPGLVDVELAGSGHMKHLRPDEIGDQKDADGPQFTRHIADIEDDEMLVQCYVGGGVKGTGQAALYKAVQPIG